MKPTSDEIDQISYSKGIEIFKDLREHCPDNTVRDADIIFNSLLCALLAHRKTFCDHDHKSFKNLVIQVLDNN